eukprot:GHVP01029751.1.p1 GENE.GHVP01029751.1~~GHVP01029751.1.p1  ORF type:complete len:349 (+),score=29.97 GHVP01029751.1:675-1721(+)
MDAIVSDRANRLVESKAHEELIEACSFFIKTPYSLEYNIFRLFSVFINTLGYVFSSSTMRIFGGSSIKSRSKSNRLLYDSFLVIICFCILLMFDFTSLFINIHKESFFKIYLLYNTTVFLDGVFSKISETLLEILHSKKLTSKETFLFGILNAFSSFLQSINILIQIFTMVSTLISGPVKLICLLYSVHFTELKSVWLKKISLDSLRLIYIKDSVKRLKILVLLFLAKLYIYNCVDLYMDAKSKETSLESKMGIILASNLLIDIIKHCLICFLNSINPRIYESYTKAHLEQFITQNERYERSSKACIFAGFAYIPLSSVLLLFLFQFCRLYIETYCIAISSIVLLINN